MPENDAIRVHTAYTLEEFREFIWFSLSKSRNYRFWKWFLLLAYPLLIPFFLLDTADEFRYAWALLIACLYAVIVYAVLFSPKKAYKTVNQLFTAGADFVFRADGFEVHANNLDGSFRSRSDFRYDALYRAYETRDMFYLFISGNQSYLVSNRGFSGGPPEALRAILSEQLGKKKFKRCD